MSATLSVAVLQPAHAYDTEILVGQTNISGPTVTVIVDTSGSMSAQVLLDGPTYDPAVTYTGPFSALNSDGSERIYYSVKQGNSVNIPTDANNYKSWLSSDNFNCSSAKVAMNTSGFFADRFAQYELIANQGIWTFLEPAGSPDDGTAVDGEFRLTECATDLGLHGFQGNQPEVYPISIDDAAGSPVYVGDGDNLPGIQGSPLPWSNDPDHPDRIEWPSTSGTYTVFSPNYLNWIAETSTTDDPAMQTRLEIVKTVSTKLINELLTISPDNSSGLNVGLMRFSSDGEGGMVLHPTSELAAGQADLLAKIDVLSPGGNTPLAETLYEAKRYLSGESPYFGLNTVPVPSIASSMENGSYKSPITKQCQKNYVVLLSDGLPNTDTSADTEIQALAGNCNGSCLDELSHYMNDNDMLPNTVAGVNNVETFVIGFFTNSALLQNTATGKILYDENGDLLDTPEDGYFLANNPDSLLNAFRKIFNNSISDVAAFTAPAVSVNSQNRLTNRDILYFTMFSPSEKGQAHWDGNLKAYRIGTLTPGDTVNKILDKDDKQAIDDDGLFIKETRSIWSAEEDGDSVTAGGMVSRLGLNRNVVSNLSINPNLLNNVNQINDADNLPVLEQITGLAGTELQELVDYATGFNPDGSARKVIGDPLHSQPFIATYAGSDDDLLLFFGTNDGYLHAVDPTPQNDTEDLEEFSFIPKILLPQLKALKADLPSVDPLGNKAYGMDGPISGWIENDDGDFVIENGENLYVYSAMRRGGSGYYALDMSNRTNPKLAFTISPGSSGYGSLGQTWSAARYAKIKISGNDKDVIIFGGGYDPGQDNDNNNPDNKGNAVYVADAKTGQLIWKATNSGATNASNLNLGMMEYSIPSDVRVMDSNQDGYADRLYVGDMGGQVWRFDINNSPATGQAVFTGGLLADLGGTGIANERRFYSPPSVALFEESGQFFYTVSIGSGYRAHPLDTKVDERLYVIRDNNVFSPYVNSMTQMPEYGDVNANLLTVETDLIQLNGTTAINNGQFGKGWMIALPNSGEKSLSTPLTADGRIFFTTYSPNGTANNTCEPQLAVGTSRLYAIDILSGLPTPLAETGTEGPFQSVLLGQSGIQPTPKLIFSDVPTCTEDCDLDTPIAPNQIDLFSGGKIFDPDISTSPRRTYWHHEGRQ